MFKKLYLLPEIFRVFCKYNFIQHFSQRPFLPRTMHLISTHRCNAQCIMCGLWKEKNTADKEMSYNNFEVLLKDRLFSRLEYIGISGGEPFLREDIVELIDLFHQKCTFLKRISITNNGILTKKIESNLGKIVRLSKKNGVLLDLSVSFHALNELLSHIYGVEGAFDKISRTIQVLKSYQQSNELSFSLNCVLLNDNIEEAPILLKWAKENNIPINFVIGEQRDRFFNYEMKDVFIGPEKTDMLLGFLRELSSEVSLNNLAAIKYKELIKMIEDKGKRSLSCYYAFSGFLLGYDGTLYYCSHSKGIGNCLKRSAYDIFYDNDNLKYRQTELIQRECYQCPPYTLTRLELAKDIFKVFKYMMKDTIIRLKKGKEITETK